MNTNPNPYKNIAQLKASARNCLSGHYTLFVLTTLFVYSVNFLLMICSVDYPDLPFPVNYGIQFLMQVLTGMLLQALQYGIFHMHLFNCCHQPVRFQDIFSVFHSRERNATKLILFFSLLLPFLQIPSDLFLYVTNPMDTIPGSEIDGTLVWLASLFPEEISDIKRWVIWGCLLAVELLLYLIFQLYFGLSYLIQMDFPDKPFPRILKMSSWLMEGNKLRFFLLMLSFLPLYILGAFSCYIGILFVVPYFYATLTCFYLDLTKKKASM
ncbi:MAG: DUF975 family protein [Lachnospiraceae bacterium]